MKSNSFGTGAARIEDVWQLAGERVVRRSKEHLDPFEGLRREPSVAVQVLLILANYGAVFGALLMFARF